VPFIEVEMAGPSSQYSPVVGKMDTGAFRSMLTYRTANLLGIVDPTKDHLGQGVAHSATGDAMPYYVHRILVRIPSGNGEPIEFPLEACFTDLVRRDLFGVDWLAHVCLALDLGAVHFLRD
jgi:hypothetical protein